MGDCGTFETNVGMQRLAEKLGMRQVGRQRQAVRKHGRYLDVIQYDLLAHEFDAKLLSASARRPLTST